jgi:hypothetical protein
MTFKRTFERPLKGFLNTFERPSKNLAKRV